MNIRVFCAVSMITGLVLGMGQAVAASSAADPARQAAMAIQNRDYPAALENLDTAVKMNPKAVGLHCNRGYVLFHQGRFLSAFRAYDRAVGLNPDFPAAVNGRGVVLVKLGELAAAGQDFDRAVALAPHNPVWLYNRGNLAADLGQMDQALEFLDKAAATGGKDPLIFYNTGVALLRTGNIDKADAAFGRALEADPGHAPSYAGLGLARLENKKPDQAKTHFDKALELDNGFNAALLRRAEAQALLSGCEKAAQDLASGLTVSFIYTLTPSEMVPETASPRPPARTMVKGAAYDPINVPCDGGHAYYARGVALFNQGKIAMALMDFNNAILQNPGHGKAFRHRGMVYQKLGEPVQAQSDFDRAAALGDAVVFDRECCLQKKGQMIPCESGPVPDNEMAAPSPPGPPGEKSGSGSY